MPPALREAGPVGLGRGAPAWHRRHGRRSLIEGETDVASRADEGETPQHVALIASLPARCAGRADQSQSLVVAQRRGRETTAVGYGSDGEQVGCEHLLPPLS